VPVLSISALSKATLVGGGGIGAGLMAHRHYANRKDIDSSDRLGMDAMWAATGAGIVAAGSAIGPQRLGSIAGAGFSSARLAGKAVLSHPMSKALGSKTMFRSIPKVARGPLGLLAVAAAAVGSIAYSSKSNNEAESYTTQDKTGEVDYNQGPGMSVKERAGLIGATGDLVFGLNNSRHGR
jgi:hypothetical protein